MIAKKKLTVTRMRKKTESLRLYNDNQRTPKVLEQSPYKLHVSLSGEDYNNYLEDIKKIIVARLEDGTINEFKFLNYKLLKAKLDSATKTAELTSNYKNMLQRNEEINHDWKNNFLML